MSSYFHARMLSCSLVARITAASLPWGALAADVPVTLAEAQRRAVERSFQIVAQDAAVAASREMAVAAGQLPDPMLRAGIDNVPVDRSRSLQPRQRLHDDAPRRRDAGAHAQGKARAARGALRARGRKGLAERAMTIAAIQRDTASHGSIAITRRRWRASSTSRSRESRLEIEAAEAPIAQAADRRPSLGAAQRRVALDDRAANISRRVRAAKIALARWIGRGGATPARGAPPIESSACTRMTCRQQIASHPRSRCFRSRRRSRTRTRSRVPTRSPTGASSSCTRAAVRRFPTWSRSASRCRCSGTRATARIASSPRSSPWPSRRAREREDAMRAHSPRCRRCHRVGERPRAPRALSSRAGAARARRTQACSPPIAAARRASWTCSRRGATRSTCACRRCSSRWTARMWAQLNFLVPDERCCRRVSCIALQGST